MQGLDLTDVMYALFPALVLVVIFIPLVPWSYVFECYVRTPGDRWWRGATTAPASP